MGHSSKRQKMSKGARGGSKRGSSGHDGSIPVPKIGNLDDDEDHVAQENLDLSSEAYDLYSTLRSWKPEPLEKLLVTPGNMKVSNLLGKRQVVTDITTVISSVVDVVIDSGTSKVGDLTFAALPTVPTVVSFPSFGPLTVPAFPTFPLQTLPTVPAFPFPATTASDAAPSSPPQGSAVAPQSSLSIDIPGASSQIVLSSPPSTPVPSDSTMTIPPASSGSYFSSATGESAVSNTATFATLTATGNLTTSALSSTGLNAGSSSMNATRTSFHSTGFLTASHNPSTFATLTTTDATLSSHLASSTDGSSPSGPGSQTGGTGVIGGGVGSPTGSGTSGTTPSSTAAAGGASGSGISPQTSAVVGGVVGGLAGLTIFLVLLLFLMRWRRKKMMQNQIRNGDNEQAPPGTSQSDAAAMTERVPLATAGIVPWIRKIRPHSGQTNTTAETASTERGFQNFGGRKIESVLTSGGDGYGGPATSNTGNLSTTSFYRDSNGTYGGPGSLPSSMFVGPGSPPLSPTRPVSSGLGLDRLGSDKEVAFMRPGPARTPVTSHEGVPSAPPTVSTPPRLATPPRPDGVGRSHPSFDGSRGSKFSENI